MKHDEQQITKRLINATSCRVPGQTSRLEAQGLLTHHGSPLNELEVMTMGQTSKILFAMLYDCGC